MSNAVREVRALEALLDQPHAPTQARALVEHFGSLPALLVARRGELVAAGVAPHDARRILATRTLARTLARRHRSRRLSSPRLVVRMVPHLSWHPVEEVWIIPVDGTMRALGCTLVARGSSASCAVTPGEIFGPVLRHRARGVFVLHNHPSGDPTPSPTDQAFTEKLCEAAKLLMITIEDHLVVGGGRFASILTRRRGEVAWPSFDTTNPDLATPRKKRAARASAACHA